MTGSVTAISADKMVKGAVTSATDMLVGKAAGVSVITDGGAQELVLQFVCVAVLLCLHPIIR